MKELRDVTFALTVGFIGLAGFGAVLGLSWRVFKFAAGIGQ